MKIVIVLGPPGSGKGTQVHLLSKALNIPFVGMGDLLREESEKETDRAQIVKSHIESGEILPWNIAESIFRDHLNVIQAPLVIFDGIPRNKDQVKHVEGLLKEYNACISSVIFLDVPEDELVRRIQTRYQCAECGMSYSAKDHSALKICTLCGSCSFSRRSDDREGLVLRRRLEVYHQMTRSLVEYYDNMGILVKIDGMLPVDVIQKDLIEKISTLQKIYTPDIDNQRVLFS